MRTWAAVLVVAPQVENLDASNTKEFRRDIETLIEAECPCRSGSEQGQLRG